MKQILTIVLLSLAIMSQAQSPYQLAKVTNDEICIDAFYMTIKAKEYEVVNVVPTEHQVFEVKFKGESNIKVINKEDIFYLHKIKKIKVTEPTTIYVENISVHQIKVSVVIMAVSL